jgi:hypothetical protein
VVVTARPVVRELTTEVPHAVGIDHRVERRRQRVRRQRLLPARLRALLPAVLREVASKKRIEDGGQRIEDSERAADRCCRAIVYSLSSILYPL